MELAVYLFVALYCIGIGITWHILSESTSDEPGADPPCYWTILLVLSLLFPLTVFVIVGLEVVDRIKRLIIG